MFRRKEEGDTSADATATPTNGAASTPSYSPQSSTPAASASPAAPASSYAPASSAARTAEAPRPAAGYRPASATPAEFNRGIIGRTAEVSRSTDKVKPNRRVLTVGNDILLKGEIATCDRLVIEGRVEAKLSDVHTVEIAESGSFKGTAEVEDAEISGLFEGDLVVRNRLVIYATGEVRGNISYGEIEIERGGKMTGQIKTVTATGASAQGKVKSIDDTKAPAPARKESVAA